MTLTDIREILATRGIMLTKSLGQNFLHDANQLHRITDLAELASGDQVLEIGPGLGPLTELLLQRGAKVLAIEMDRRLVQFLQERFSAELNSGVLTLLNADALIVARDRGRNWAEWKLVSNLPYSVASPILVELANNPAGPERMVVTLQSEVALRIAARPDEDDYGLLTVLLQARYQPSGLIKIPASCFFPAPDVDSACIRLNRIGVCRMSPEEHKVFTRVAKRGFSQRRKMMFKLLRADWPEETLKAGMEQAGISLTERAEKVSVDQFVVLAKFLYSPGQRNDEPFDVVNENDEVIGVSTRGEVHRLGLMHRAVHVLVFNSAGKVFLQKRSRFKDRHPGAWDSSASGHLDSGESYDACAERELVEELGVAAENSIEMLFKLPASSETDQEHVCVYRTVHEGPFQLNPREIECGEWWKPGEVTSALASRPQEFATAFRTLWAKQAQTNPMPRPHRS